MSTGGFLSSSRHLIGPSILSADLSNLGAVSRKFLSQGADYLHLDVMDGHFVPNLTFGPPLIACLRQNIPRPVFFDVHLMVSDPRKWIIPMADAGSDQFTFHLEAVKEDNILEVISEIKSHGMLAGISIKPGTPVQSLQPEILSSVSTVLVMTVEPGFGLQKFMAEQLEKVSWLRTNSPSSLNIQVDGGVSVDTILACQEAGANLFVVGGAITKAHDSREAISKLKAKIGQN